MRPFTRLIVGQDQYAIGIDQVVRHSNSPLLICDLSGPVRLEVLSLNGDLTHLVFHFLGQPHVFRILRKVREGRKVEVFPRVFRP